LTGPSLESPSSPDDLYLASTPDEVEPARPFLTGDVFDGIEIPGLTSSGLAVVLTHPCSMRIDGVNLAERLLMALVRESADIPLHRWTTGHFRVMPLPGLLGGHHSASFEDIGLVRSGVLAETPRVGCLTPFGVNLLQQRFIWHLTRFLVPTHRLGEAAEAVFAEADLAEEWVETAMGSSAQPKEAQRAFHDWIRAVDRTGVSRQSRLREAQHVPGIRREMLAHLRREAD